MLVDVAIDSRRRVFYLFRSGTLPPTLLARFTDGENAQRAAKVAEQLGWQVSVTNRPAAQFRMRHRADAQ